jgi:hypothetical protein
MQSSRGKPSAMNMDVRGTLECGGSTPPWNNAEVKDKSGVEPPHSKVLRTLSSRKAPSGLEILTSNLPEPA